MISKKEEIVEAIMEFDRLAEGKKYIFLDEISFIKDWQNAVKFLLDSPISRDKLIYITGSSIAGLKKEMFPGRNIKIKEFLPLMFREFCVLFGSKHLKEHIGKRKVPALMRRRSYDPDASGVLNEPLQPLAQNTSTAQQRRTSVSAGCMASPMTLNSDYSGISCEPYMPRRVFQEL